MEEDGEGEGEGQGEGVEKGRGSVKLSRSDDCKMPVDAKVV